MRDSNITLGGPALLLTLCRSARSLREEAMKLSPAFVHTGEFEALQRVFKNTIAQDWFARSPENEHQLATFLARTFHHGVTDELTLELVAVAAAKQRYCK
jgi:hypothetical protein